MTLPSIVGDFGASVVTGDDGGVVGVDVVVCDWK